MNGHFLVAIGAAMALFGAAIAIDAMEPTTRSLETDDCVGSASGATDVEDCPESVGEDVAEPVDETDEVCPPAREEVVDVVFDPDERALTGGRSVGASFGWAGSCPGATFFLATYERATGGALTLYEVDERPVQLSEGDHRLGPVSLPACTFTVVLAVGPMPQGGEVPERAVVRTVEGGTGACTEEETPDPSPSPSPSARPSPSPSPTAPSPSPSPSDSASPTPDPSETPTDSPSPSPSESPTESPSPSPTESPSESPSPSPSPSESPSESPSPSPSESPSESPSPSPSESPSESPASSPSPSDDPSGNESA